MNKNKSYVEKSMEMTINLGNFESLKVRSLIGEDIEWETYEEKEEKQNDLHNKLVKDLREDALKAINMYNLSDRTDAFVQNNMKISPQEQRKKAKMETKRKNERTTKEHGDFDLGE